MRQTNRLHVDFYCTEKPDMAVQFRRVKPQTDSRTKHIQRNALPDSISNAVIFTDIEQQKAINLLMIRTQENERNELGRELHDNINQILAAVKLQLEYSLENYDEEKGTIEKCKTNIETVIQEIRNLSHRLVLPRFAETTLLAELQKTIDNILQQQPVYLDLHGLNESLIPDNIKESIYRIIQEQLTNIIRHSRAQKATIKIHNSAYRVFLCIEDDGIGFNTSQCRNGVGITNILNRVETYNGKATITAAPGKGCRIDVAIPLRSEK